MSGKTSRTKTHNLISKIQENTNFLLVSFLVLIFLVISLSSIRHTTLTYDENAHFQYGENILNLNAERFDDSKMPFSALNALPAKISLNLPRGQLQRLLSKIGIGRIATILFSTAVSLLVFFWSRSLYGVIPGIFSLALYVLDPNIIAHSRLITTDIYAVGMISLAIFTLWRFSNKRDIQHAAVSATILGLAQLAKYTSIFLYPLFFLLIIVQDTPYLFSTIKHQRLSLLYKYLKWTIFYGLLFILISVFIINIGFLFNRTLTSLSDYDFRSQLFNSIKEAITPIVDFPVPVPYPYLQGLDWVLEYERTGENFGRIYLFGQLREGEGFLGYYSYASLLKVPIATLILILVALVHYLVNRRLFKFLRNEFFLLGPIIFFWIYFNIFNQAQIGIRYILVVFPFLYIFCGSLLKNWGKFRLIYKTGIGALVLYLCASVFSYHPHYLTYFNEVVWDRRDAYKYLADSNLDWGQGKWYLRQYLKTHPEAIFQPKHPTSGLIVVSINNLVGVIAEPDKFRWLRDNFEPTATIANSYLIYEITPEDLDRVQ